MLIKHLKDLYISTLSSIYDEREAVSIFYICAEDICSVSRRQLAVRDSIEDSDAEKLLAALEELKKSIPVQYVTGKAYFYGRMFNVDNRVLIPRGETEELVEWILCEHDDETKKNVLDIGVGSGAICVSLSCERKNWRVEGVDVSSDAIQVAMSNAQNLSADVKFICMDILDEEKWTQTGKYDIIVSNPPYVLESERDSMHSNVTLNEPSIALYVPDDKPLLFYSKIALYATTHLNEGGSLYFEINEAYGKQMVEMLKDMGYRDVSLRSDINGKDRMVRACK